MTFNGIMPMLLTGLLAALLLGAGFLLAFGAPRSRPAGWALAAGIFVAAVLAACCVFFRNEAGVPLLDWSTSWVEAGPDSRWLYVGLKDEPFSLLAILVGALIALGFLVSVDVYDSERAHHRVHAAAAIGVCATALSWLSLTPWLGLLSAGLSLFGGFVLLGTQSGSSNDDASFAFRYAFERYSGLIVVLIGVLAMTWVGADLTFMKKEASPASGGALGALVVAIGVTLFFRPFPFLAWTSMKSRVNAPARILLAEVLPGLVMFGFLFRMEPIFRATGTFPLFGWVPLACALLTTLGGLFQREPSRALSCWLSSGFCLAYGALAQVGSGAAFAILLGVILGLACFVIAAGSLERGTGAGLATPTGLLALVGAAGATGMFGFVSGGGYFQMLRESAVETLPLVVVGVNFLLLVYFLWKVVFETEYLDRARRAGPAAVLVPGLLGVGAVSLPWSGSLSGGILPSGSDQLMYSILGWAAESRSAVGLSEDGSLVAYWVYGVGLVLGILGAYWSRSTWQRWAKTPPRLGRFLSGGYGLDRLAKAIHSGLSAFGLRSETLLTEQIWSRGLARGGWRTVQAISRAAIRVDGALASGINGTSQRFVAVPAKLLQVIQSGDFQWYLLFAVGCAAGILIHYLRIRT